MCEGWRLFIWLVSLPHCVVIIMYMEYKDVIKMLVLRRKTAGLDQENSETVIINSPIRLLGEGQGLLD